MNAPANGFMVNVSFDVHSSRLEDLVNSALEAPSTYGCGYWAQLVKRQGNPFGSFGGSWKFQAIGDDGRLYTHTNGLEEFALDAASIQSGLRALATKYPAKFAQFMQEDTDAPLGDLYLQCCLFGEEVFA